MRHLIPLVALPVLVLAILGMARNPASHRVEAVAATDAHRSAADPDRSASDPELELTFLGTGAAWPVPRLGCPCQTCEKAKTTSPRTRRMRSALKIGRDAFLLVDMGMDVYRQLLPLERPRPAAILLTHTHLDHAGGATDLFPLIRNQPIGLLSSPTVWSELQAASPWAGKSFAFTDARTPRAVGPYTIRTFDLLHGTSAVGFRVDVKGRSVAYVCDVDSVPDASLPALSGLDLMILDGATAMDSAVHANRHIDPDQIRALLARTHPKRVIFTHIGHGASWHEVTAERARERFGGEVAYDGLQLSL